MSEPLANVSSSNVAPQKPRVWTVFLAFVTMVIVGGIASGVYVVVAALMTGDHSNRPRAMVERVLENTNIMIPSFAIMGITTLLVTAICCWLSPERVWARISLQPSRLGFSGYVAAIVMVFGISTVIGQLILPFIDTKSATLKLIDGRLRSADSMMFALGVAIIAGLAPLAEEVFFRGYMQTRLRRRWGPAWAIGITAVAFGALHADRVQSPFAIAIGVALGYVAERSGSIRPAIVCHIINNTLAVIAIKFREGEGNQSRSWPMVVVGIIASTLGVMWLRRLEKRSTSVALKKKTNSFGTEA